MLLFYEWCGEEEILLNIYRIQLFDKILMITNSNIHLYLIIYIHCIAWLILLLK